MKESGGFVVNSRGRNVEKQLNSLRIIDYLILFLVLCSRSKSSRKIKRENSMTTKLMMALFAVENQLSK